MIIRISEVWDGGSSGAKQLAIIKTNEDPKVAVFSWVRVNRPDLELCTSIYGHGYHAKQIG